MLACDGRSLDLSEVDFGDWLSLNNRTIIICSNQEYEYSICDKSLSIMDYLILLVFS